MLQQSRTEPIAATHGASPLIGVLTNRGSDRNRRSADKIANLLERNPHIFHFELTDIADIPQALSMFADARVSTLVINGGDGTVQAALSSLVNDRPFEIPPPIAVLPGGKTNMIAADLGMRGKPERQVKRLLKRMRRRRRAPKKVERNLIALDMGDGAPPRLGMFFGTAGVVNGLLWCRRRVHPLDLPSWAAHLAALWLLIFAAIARQERSPLRSEPLTVHLDGGETMRGRYSIVLATTLDHLLFRLRPYGRTGPGALGFSAVEAGGGAMWRAFLALLAGRFSNGGVDGLHVRRTDHLEVEGNEPITLDGEIYHPVAGRPIRLTGEHRLTFLKL